MADIYARAEALRNEAEAAMGAVVAINAQMRQGVQPPLPLGTPPPLPPVQPPQPLPPGAAGQQQQAGAADPAVAGPQGAAQHIPLQQQLQPPILVPRMPATGGNRPGAPPGTGLGQIGAAVVQQRRATTGGRFNFYGPNYSSRVTREFSNSSSSSHIIQESFNSSSSRPRDRSVTRPCWHSSSSRDSLPWEGTAARSAQEERLAQCRRRRRCTACRACGSSLGMEHISLCVFLHSPSLLNRPRSTARAGRQGIVGRNSLQTGFRASSLSLSQENC
jgi:hypothetical protein